MNSVAKIKDRLKEMMGSDARPLQITQVIKSDLAQVLKSYFELDEQSLTLKIEPQGDGYNVSFYAHAANIKALNYLR